jgi:hypothetical protein
MMTEKLLLALFYVYYERTDVTNKDNTSIGDLISMEVLVQLVCGCTLGYTSPRRLKIDDEGYPIATLWI